MTNNSGRPYEWATVINWALSLFLFGLTTASTPFESGANKLALGLVIGVAWAVIGGLIIALWKLFKRSPVANTQRCLEATKEHDKVLFILAMVIAALLTGKGIYLKSYGPLIDAAILIALGLGVRADLHIARWLFTIYAFVTPILIITFDGGSAALWPFIFFYACSSIIMHENKRSGNATENLIRELPSRSVAADTATNPRTEKQPQHDFLYTTDDLERENIERNSLTSHSNSTLNNSTDNNKPRTGINVAITTMKNPTPSESIAPITNAVNTIPKSTPTTTHNTHPHRVSRNNFSTDIDISSIYAKVAEEIESGNADKGLWTRLWVECEGDDNKTKVLYIKQRTNALIANEKAQPIDEQYCDEEHSQNKEESDNCIESTVTLNMTMREKLVSSAMKSDLLPLKAHKDAPEFWESILFGHIEKARIILDNAPQLIDLCNGEGNTPLHTTIINMDSNLAKLLIERGALSDTKNNYGKSPLDLATSNELTELAILLSAISEYKPHNPQSKDEILLSKGYTNSERKYKCDKCGYTGEMYIKNPIYGPGNILCIQCGWEFEYTGRLMLR